MAPRNAARKEREMSDKHKRAADAAPETRPEFLLRLSVRLTEREVRR